MAGKPGFVPKPLFKKIRRNVPLPTVDALIMKDGRLLIVKRTQEPMKGRWWFVGGRVNKNEKLTHAVRRKVREETGLDCCIVRQVGSYDNIYRKSGVHNVVVTYVIQATGGRLRLDETSSDFRYVSNSRGLYKYLRNVIRDAGCFNGNGD